MLKKTPVPKKPIRLFAFFLLMAFIFNCPGVFAQIYFEENFSGNTMPPVGWSLEAFTNQQHNPWEIDHFDQFPDAGGTVPEGIFIYYLPAEGTSRLISPVMDLSGISTATLSFRHRFSWVVNGPAIGVATRSGAGPWNVVWQLSPTQSFGPDQQNIILENPGQSDFQFCFFVSANQTAVGWWAIDNIRIFSPLSLDAKISSVLVPRYVATQDSFQVAATVSNEGQAVIHSFNVSYSVDAGAEQSQHFSGLNLELGDSMELVHALPAVLNQPGNSSIEVRISEINGQQDANPQNNRISRMVSAVTYRPKKMVLAELATGTWCGFCVRSSCFMDYMQANYPETWIGVAMHNNDPMMHPPYNNAIPQIIPGFDGGYPSVTSDRTPGNDLPNNLEARYLERIRAVSPATIEIKNYFWDPVSQQLSFDLESEFVADVNSELRFGAIITEDSVTGFSQANNYSGGSFGPMCGFENLPNPIPPSQIHFDHVARLVLDGPFGSPGSLPATVSNGAIHSKSFTCTILSSWDYNRLSVIGFLLNTASGEILNATNRISTYSQTNSSQSGFPLHIYPNPAQDVIRVVTPEMLSGEPFSILDFSGRILISGKLQTGEMPVSLNGLGEGIYLFCTGTNKNAVHRFIRQQKP